VNKQAAIFDRLSYRCRDFGEKTSAFSVAHPTKNNLLAL
jgi:hypothetical protein